MFGKNPVEKAVENDDGKIRVVKGSPFYTIQGEGPYMGRPAIFVRLHGCNLRCWFCDTQFSDEDDPEISEFNLASEIVALSAKHHCSLIVITGGEPARWHLAGLIHYIREGIFQPTIQLETAGTIWKPWMSTVDIVVSPKTAKIHDKVAERAVAFKYIVGSDVDVTPEGRFRVNTQEKRVLFQLDQPPLLAAPIRAMTPVYVSPCDEYDPVINAQNIKQVTALALKHGYYVSLQMHKLLNVL